MPSSTPEPGTGGGAAPWNRLRRSLHEHELDRSAGPSFDRYEIRAELGRGGMAVVHRAWDRQLQREVALKLLRTDMKLGTAASRLRREAQVAAQLSHPNLVSVYDAGDKDGQIYLVMELVSGPNLAEVLLGSGLGLDAKLVIVEKIARAVAVAHERGVVHRDLKPGNVLMTPSGEPKVSDFGLAHLASSETKLTHTGAAIGTPMYMAPEQVLGRNEEITPRTDVFALGAILYEMVYGQPPFRGETSAEIYRRVVEDDPAFPRPSGPRVHRDLETILVKALQKSPLKRYASATAFADDLARFRAHEPIQAQPLTFLSRLLHRGHKHRRILVPSAVAIAVVFAVLAWSVRGSLETRRRVREAVGRAEALEARGELEKALADFKAAAELDPGAEAARAGVERTLAALVRREQERSEALTLLEKARPIVDQAVRSFYRADEDTTALLERVRKEALPLAEAAVAKSPRLPPAHLVLGSIQDLLGMEPQAEASWRAAVAIDPAFGPARYQLGRLMLVRVTTVLTAMGGAEKAVGVAQEAMEHVRAAVQTGSGFNDEIQREVARAMVGYSEAIQARGLWGDLHHQLQDLKYDTTPAAAARRAELEPLLRERAEEMKRGFNEAATLCRAAAERFGRAEGVEYLHWLRGISLSGKEATAEVEEALRICPKFPLGLMARAEYLQEAGRLGDAIAEYTQVLRVRPGLKGAYTNRGDLRYQLGQLAEAIADFKEVLRLSPGDWGGHFNLGNAQIKAGDYDGAVDTLTRALVLRPDDAATHYYRARARFAKEDWAGAAQDCEQCTRFEINYTDAYLCLGRCREELGRPGDAVKAYEEFLKRLPRPDWPNVKFARERLQALRNF